MSKLGFAPLTLDSRNVFAIRFGEAKQSRLDTHYYLPKFVKTEKTLHHFKGNIIQLRNVLQVDPLNGVDARNYIARGQRYLRVQNIRPFEIDTKKIKHVEPVGTKEVGLAIGDILLTRKGSFGYAAEVAKEHIDCLISSEIILLRVSKAAPCSPSFIVTWLNYLFAQTLFDKR